MFNQCHNYIYKLNRQNPIFLSHSNIKMESVTPLVFKSHCELNNATDQQRAEIKRCGYRIDPFAGQFAPEVPLAKQDITGLPDFKVLDVPIMPLPTKRRVARKA